MRCEEEAEVERPFSRRKLGLSLSVSTKSERDARGRERRRRRRRRRLKLPAQQRVQRHHWPYVSMMRAGSSERQHSSLNPESSTSSINSIWVMIWTFRPGRKNTEHSKPWAFHSMPGQKGGPLSYAQPVAHLMITSARSRFQDSPRRVWV